MGDEEAIFDPSLKKKKKKKTGFNIDSVVTEVAPTKEEAPQIQENGESLEQNEESVNLEDGEFGKKKPKKKKKPFNLDELKDTLDESGGDKSNENGSVPTIESMDFDNMDMYMTKKKKKKTKKQVGLEDLLGPEEGKDDLENKENESGDTWNDTDRDYTYDELLQRAFNQLREKNPDMATGEKKKFVMKPPQVVRIGSKKSAFANFSEICRLLHRTPKHLLQFLLSELGTSGSIDGSNQLIIKGKFQQKHIENVLRGYIKEYVTCHTCRSPNTILQKDARLYFLQCEQCNSRCSVAPIKSGFQAVANKQQRQAIRASKN